MRRANKWSGTWLSGQYLPWWFFSGSWTQSASFGAKTSALIYEIKRRTSKMIKGNRIREWEGQVPTCDMLMTPSEERRLEAAVIKMAKAAKSAGLPVVFFAVSRGLYADLTLTFSVPGQYSKILSVGRCGGYSRVYGKFTYGRVKNRFINRLRGDRALDTMLEEIKNG
jgi:hypothetical protein